MKITYIKSHFYNKDFYVWLSVQKEVNEFKVLAVVDMTTFECTSILFFDLKLNHFQCSVEEKNEVFKKVQCEINKRKIEIMFDCKEEENHV